MTENNTYLIPAVNMSRLQMEIARLNKKATKLKCKPVELIVLDTITRKFKDEILGFEYQRVFHECIVSGDAPKLNGWMLIAAIEPQPNGENVIREVPGQKCPDSYRSTDTRCDHCDTKRRRKEIFIVRNEEGKYQQVGRNCIADFLGHQNPESVIATAEFLMSFTSSLSDSEDMHWGSGGGMSCLDMEHFVAMVAIVSRRLGWVPRSKSDELHESTASLAWRICTARPEEKAIKELVREKDIVMQDIDLELANKAIAWASQIDPKTAPNTYLHDLGVCCRQPFVTYKNAGYVASVVSAYQREVSKEIEARAPKGQSKALGEIKQRLVFKDLKITHTTSYESQFGSKTFVRFVDPEGNVLVWRATGWPDWVVLDKTVTIRGTVKSHDTYRNQINTVLQRVEPVTDIQKEGDEPSEGDQE